MKNPVKAKLEFTVTIKQFAQPDTRTTFYSAKQAIDFMVKLHKKKVHASMTVAIVYRRDEKTKAPAVGGGGGREGR